MRMVAVEGCLTGLHSTRSKLTARIPATIFRDASQNTLAINRKLSIVTPPFAPQSIKRLGLTTLAYDKLTERAIRIPLQNAREVRDKLLPEASRKFEEKVAKIDFPALEAKEKRFSELNRYFEASAIVSICFGVVGAIISGVNALSRFHDAFDPWTGPIVAAVGIVTLAATLFYKSKMRNKLDAQVELIRKTINDFRGAFITLNRVLDDLIGDLEQHVLKR